MGKCLSSQDDGSGKYTYRNSSAATYCIGYTTEVIVIPETYVYVIPDIDVDLFFWNGWWWRLWEGRWYRSHYYDRGWGYYNYVPSLYFDVDPGWRGYYRDHNQKEG